MILSQQASDRIIVVSHAYLGRPFDWDNFNCVHFVRKVYGEVQITMPVLVRTMLPPREFHLSKEEFALMPLGHSVFLKRKAEVTARPWTHIAIIAGLDKVIHCSRFMGDGVIISSRDELMDIYDLASSVSC